jgi:hypothetical protein
MIVKLLLFIAILELSRLSSNALTTASLLFDFDEQADSNRTIAKYKCILQKLQDGMVGEF